VKPALRQATVAALVATLAVSMSGCITVYPFRSAIAASEGPGNLDLIVVVAYEREFEASTCIPPDSGSDSRAVYVPEFSEYVAIFVQAKLSSIPAGFESIDSRQFDFTVADGNGTEWVDIHLRNNSTQKELIVQGPRPGAWTVTLSWAMCSLPGAKIQDGFLVRVLVRQPE
jgi:hypothetical protein